MSRWNFTGSTRPCENCGEDSYRPPTSKYCPDCREKRHKSIADEKAEMAQLMREMDARKRKLGVKW